MFTVMRAACTAVAVFGWSLASAQVTVPMLPTTTWRGLGTLSEDGGPARSAARALSANGQVVVGESTGRAFQWTLTGGMVELPAPGANPFLNEAVGVSADGSVIAGTYHGSTTHSFAWKWSASSGMQQLPAPSIARALASGGSPVVGNHRSDAPYFWSDSGVLTFGEPGAVHTLTGVSASVAVGFSAQTPGVASRRPVRWTRVIGGAVHTLSLEKLPGNVPGGEALAISGDTGTVVGWSFEGPTKVAVKWLGSTGIIGYVGTPPGATQSWATAVSHDGSILVGNAMNESGIAPFIADANGIRWLLPLIEEGLNPPGIAGWKLTDVVGIASDSKHLYFAGNGTNPAHQAEGWWARVKRPKP